MDSSIAPHWDDYELLDSGNGLKLERWGKYTLVRPETSAIWKPKRDFKYWKSIAHATFEYQNKRSGSWNKKKDIPKSWQVKYKLGENDLVFNLELTKFKHLGLFPEQAENWEYIHKRLSQKKQPKVLNLFAYTGGASLAACASGAKVTHIDSIKQVISWANKNMQDSNLRDIRWIVEDALKFVHKEIKRNSKYDMIILDPPTWGLGPKGQRWKLEDKLHELLQGVSKILEDKCTVIINTYSGLSPTMMNNICSNYFNDAKIDSSELLLKSNGGYNIPTGTVVRIEV